MKRELVMALGAVGALALGTTAQAAVGFPVTFDEFGGITAPGGFVGPAVPDPRTTGGPGATVAYVIPFTVITGDVIMTEPPTGTSDVVRFVDLGTGSSLILFYSDNLDGADSPADVGLPSQIAGAPIVVIPEVGVEGNNGAAWTPDPGDPGFDLSGPPLTYNIISDGVVPEPASLGLLALGGVGLMLRRRRA